LYDTVTVKGWSVDVRTHRIGEIINKVLADPWPVDKDSEPSKPDVSAQKFWNWWGWGRRGPGKGKGGEGDDGDDGWEKHGGVPKAESEDECVDCYKWSVLTEIPMS
jgi:lipase ATG15